MYWKILKNCEYQHENMILMLVYIVKKVYVRFIWNYYWKEWKGMKKEKHLKSRKKMAKE